MEERKKYELLVFLTIYVIFIGLMVPVGIKLPEVFIAALEGRYGKAVRPEPVPADAYSTPAVRYVVPLVVLAAAGVLALGTYYGAKGVRKLTRRDYRVTRRGRAECSGALTQRPRCRHYRPTPSTECAYFLGSRDEGMCVRKAPGRRPLPKTPRHSPRYSLRRASALRHQGRAGVSGIALAEGSPDTVGGPLVMACSNAQRFHGRAPAPCR